MWGTIINGILGTGATLIGGGMQGAATKEAQKEALGLAERARKDDLAEKARNYRLNVRTLDFQEDQARLNRQDARQQTAYNQMADQRNFLQNLVNSDDNLKMAVANLKYSRRM